MFEIGKLRLGAPVGWVKTSHPVSRLLARSALETFVGICRDSCSWEMAKWGLGSQSTAEATVPAPGTHLVTHRSKSSQGQCLVQASPVASLYLNSGEASPISFPLRPVETALDNSNRRITPFWEARPPPSPHHRDLAAVGSGGRGRAGSRCSGVCLCSLCPSPAVCREYQVLGPGRLPGDLQ